MSIDSEPPALKKEAIYVSTPKEEKGFYKCPPHSELMRMSPETKNSLKMFNLEDLEEMSEEQLNEMKKVVANLMSEIIGRFKDEKRCPPGNSVEIGQLRVDYLMLSELQDPISKILFKRKNKYPDTTTVCGKLIKAAILFQNMKETNQIKYEVFCDQIKEESDKESKEEYQIHLERTQKDIERLDSLIDQLLDMSEEVITLKA